MYFKVIIKILGGITKYSYPIKDLSQQISEEGKQESTNFLTSKAEKITLNTQTISSDQEDHQKETNHNAFLVNSIGKIEEPLHEENKKFDQNELNTNDNKNKNKNNDTESKNMIEFTTYENKVKVKVEINNSNLEDNKQFEIKDFEQNKINQINTSESGDEGDLGIDLINEKDIEFAIRDQEFPNISNTNLQNVEIPENRLAFHERRHSSYGDNDQLIENHPLDFISMFGSNGDKIIDDSLNSKMQNREKFIPYKELEDITLNINGVPNLAYREILPIENIYFSHTSLRSQISNNISSIYLSELSEKKDNEELRKIELMQSVMQRENKLELEQDLADLRRQYSERIESKSNLIEDFSIDNYSSENEIKKLVTILQEPQKKSLIFNNEKKGDIVKHALNLDEEKKEIIKEIKKEQSPNKIEEKNENKKEDKSGLVEESRENVMDEVKKNGNENTEENINPALLQEEIKEEKKQENKEEKKDIDLSREQFYNSLPEEIKLEVLSGELNQIGKSNAPANEMDPATFLSTLTPELRREILSTSPPEFLASLPPHFIAEAQNLRHRSGSSLSRPFNERKSKEKGNQKAENNYTKTFEMNFAEEFDKLNPDLILKNNLLNSMKNIDEASIENVLKILFLNMQDKIPINFLIYNLCNEKLQRNRIMDALIFILLNKELFDVKNKEFDFNFNFPPKKLFFTKDSFQCTYFVVSLRILSLLSLLIHKPLIIKYLTSGKYPNPKSSYCLNSIQKIHQSLKIDLLSNYPVSLMTNLLLNEDFKKSEVHLKELIKLLIDIVQKSIEFSEKAITLNNNLKIEAVIFDKNSIKNIILKLIEENKDSSIYNEIYELIFLVTSIPLNSKNIFNNLRELIIHYSKILSEKNNNYIDKIQQNKIKFICDNSNPDFKFSEDRLQKCLELLLKIFNSKNKDRDKQSLSREISSDNRSKISAVFEENIEEEILLRLSSSNKGSSSRERDLLTNEDNTEIETIFSCKELFEGYEILINLFNCISSNSKFKDLINCNLNFVLSLIQIFLLSYQHIFINNTKCKQILVLLKKPNNTNERYDKLALLMSKFIKSAKRIINELIQREETSKIMNLLQPIIIKIPAMLDFENKRKYFIQRIRELREQNRQQTIHLSVKRNEIFRDSFLQIMSKTADEMFGRTSVEFLEEEGLDAGGLTREWFQLLSRAMFNPAIALFELSQNKNTYQPSTKSIIEKDHITYFKFVGRIIGKALLDNQTVECFFTRSLYKLILGQPLTYSDLEDVDPDFYKSLKWLMENDLSNEKEDVGINFSYERDFFGKIETKELIPGGKSIPVTENNKKDFIHLICKAKLYDEIHGQIDSLLKGIYEIIPKDLISIFDFRELELLISGLPDFDVEDLKENTEYHRYHESDDIIKWFWEIIESFNNTEKAEFLQFVTGTSKIPVGGFKELQGMYGNQKFQIHKAISDQDYLPTSHTCFAQLDLPKYSSKEILEEKLRLAIKEGKEGFGFI